MYKIGIIGAGQLGSRHLQSIALVDQPVIIYVADISGDSLKIAEQRFNEVNSRFGHKAVYTNSIKEFPNELDIVIVATNSIVRSAVINDLLQFSEVKHLILEKFLFPQLSDFEIVKKLFDDRPTMRVWVNCTRRTFSTYKDIAAKISQKGPIYFSVTGSGWGLGCNSIHFVDLFSYLSKSIDLKVLSESIDNEYFDSKRAGYIEFSGGLYLGDTSGNRMEVLSYKNGSHPIIIRISTPDAIWIINESSKSMQFAEASTGWVFTASSLSFPLQSEVGSLVINNLLSNNTCDLSTYEQSQILHIELLKIFLTKYNTLNKEIRKLCPIT
jgi:hypothetical protein